MSEKMLLHLIAIIATLLFGLIYAAGYISGSLGWWWTVIGAVAVYFLILKLLGGHH